MFKYSRPSDSLVAPILRTILDTWNILRMKNHVQAPVGMTAHATPTSTTPRHRSVRYMAAVPFTQNVIGLLVQKATII